MRRWLRRALTLLCAGLLMPGALVAAADYAVSDDAGVRTHFSAPPQRVVSLLPSLTETVCALAACERLVGVDRYSDWPPSVRKLPQLGGGLAPNVEAVVALRPDVVLIGTSSRAAARLRALGLRVVTLEPHTIAGAERVIRRVAQVLQVDGAPALIAHIQAGISAAAGRVPAAARGERVYFEVSPAPYAAGSASFVGELLRAVHLENIIPAALGPFPKINPEFVVIADPALIMVSGATAAELARRPGWSAMRALRAHAVCDFDAAQRDVLVRPGPRMADAAALMAACAADPADFHASVAAR